MRIKWLLPAVLVVAIVVPLVSFLAASGQSSLRGAPSADGSGWPAKLELVPGTSVLRVVLSAPAAERLGIETSPVRANSRFTTTRGGPRTVISYSAVLYDVHGDTWVYTNPEPLVFVRHRVSVDYIDGEDAVLSDGPAPGTMVVTVGGAQLLGVELFGPEFEVDQ